MQTAYCLIEQRVIKVAISKEFQNRFIELISDIEVKSKDKKA